MANRLLLIYISSKGACPFYLIILYQCEQYN